MYIPKIAQIWGDRFLLLPIMLMLLGFCFAVVPIVTDMTSHQPISPLNRVMGAVILGFLSMILWAITFSGLDGTKVGFWFGVGFLVGFDHRIFEYFMFLFGYQLSVLLMYLDATRQADAKQHPMNAMLDDLERASEKVKEKE